MIRTVDKTEETDADLRPGDLVQINAPSFQTHGMRAQVLKYVGIHTRIAKFANGIFRVRDYAYILDISDGGIAGGIYPRFVLIKIEDKGKEPSSWEKGSWKPADLKQSALDRAYDFIKRHTSDLETK